MRFASSLVFFALAATGLRADTVTRKDRVSINGAVTLAAGVVTIAPDGSGRLAVNLRDVATIEFNRTKFNAGGSPAGVRNPSSAVPVPTSTVMLHGGGRKACLLAAIDANNVRCGGSGGEKAEDIPRDSVLRILVGRQ